MSSFSFFASAPSSAVDPRGPRFGACLTSLLLAGALVSGSSGLLLAQTVLFALGVAGRSPYVWLYRVAVRPRLGPPAALEDVRPLRFAQAVGLGFALVAVAGLASGVGAVTTTATAAALAAAFLNAAFGVCLGCEVYLLLARGRGAPTPSTTPTSTSNLSEASA